MDDDWRGCSDEEAKIIKDFMLTVFRLHQRSLPDEGLTCEVMGINITCQDHDQRFIFKGDDWRVINAGGVGGSYVFVTGNKVSFERDMCLLKLVLS